MARNQRSLIRGLKEVHPSKSRKNQKKAGIQPAQDNYPGCSKCTIAQPDFTSILLGFAFSTLGNTSLRTPSLIDALILL